MAMVYWLGCRITNLVLFGSKPLCFSQFDSVIHLSNVDMGDCGESLLTMIAG